MMKNLFVIVGCCVAIAALSGCVNTLDGRKQAGVPGLKDKIESKYQFPPAQVLTAARAALKHNGTIVSDDSVTQTVTAKVDTRTVIVKVSEIDPKVTGVIVQVRAKGGGTDIDLAAEIDKQIALNLK
jgi:hypothetical protein